MPETPVAHLIETWEIHDRINRYLLQAISPEALGSRAGGKGRTVAEMFAHIHNVRLMWLKSAAPELLGGLDKIERDQAIDPAVLATALTASGAAVAVLLTAAVTSGRVKGFKPHPAAFLGYLISHESHHRGEIGIALTLSGHPLDLKTAFGLWEWGVR